MSRQLSDRLPASFQSVVNPALVALNQAQVIDWLWSKDHQLWKRVQLGRDQAATVNAITAALTGNASSGCRTASKKRRKITRR